MPVKNKEILFDLVKILPEIDSYDESLRIINRKLSEYSQADIALVMMINPQTHKTIKTVMREDHGDFERSYHFVSEAITGWILKNNSPLSAEDLRNDSRFPSGAFKKLPVKSCIAVPLKIENRIIGTFIILNYAESGTFDRDDLEFLWLFSSVSAPYLSNLQRIKEFFESPLPDSEIARKYSDLGLLGRSARYIELIRAIESASKCEVRILLEGETGVGKEVVAKAIHNLSHRKNRKIVVLDCGAFPQNLIESELFGHTKGAFTGAASERIGLIEEADGSTLFIDEISYLTPELQAKFLRFLQEGEFRPVGSNRVAKVDVRVIAASSCSLSEMVKEGKFRAELFYRLNVYPIEVPSLNKRRDDIPMLTHHFMSKFALKQQKKCETFDEKIMLLMLNRSWSGNVRELENFIERMVTLAPDDSRIIDSNILPAEYKKEIDRIMKTGEGLSGKIDLEDSMREFEEQLIRMSLVKNNWNQSRAAESLSIKEQTLRYKMGKYGISPPDS